MKNLILLVFIFQQFLGLSQDTFIKEIDQNFFSTASIVATPDNGWLILAEESLQLTKYNQCGELQWSKNYDIINQNCCIGTQIVLGLSGEIFLLSRHQVVFQDYVFRVTALDATGAVLWNRSYQQTGVDYFPYSLLISPLGDVFVFANKAGVGTGFSTLTKLNTSGDVIWSKKYDNGGTWGEAIITQDSGFLMRRGDEFIKLDSNGVVEWSARVALSNTYYYRAPVEVSDGYIFTKQKQGGQEVGFHKLDKQGNLLWGGGQYTAHTGVPNPLVKMANGNFVTILNINTNTPFATANIVEFDKDLNIVKKNGIIGNKSSWYLNDITFSKNNDPLVVGKVSAPNFQQFVFGKLDEEYQVGCDTNINITFNFLPGTFTPETVGESTNALTTNTVSITSSNATLTAIFTCINTTVKVVRLAEDTTICGDTSLTLQNLSTSTFSTYLWSTGETTPTITVNTSGTYWVECSNPCVATTYSDTMILEVADIQDPNLTTDTALCGDNTLTLNAEIPQGQYLWQDNSTLPTFLVSQPGNYHVDIALNNCVQRFESRILACEEYIIPNIFTPNGDDINDYFEVLYYGAKPFECKVYNRWGQLIFETYTARFQWDGTINGTPLSDGVFYYLITIGDEKIQGNVTMVH